MIRRPILAAALLVLAGCAGGGDGRGGGGDDRLLDPNVAELWSVGGIDGLGWEAFSDRIEVAFDENGRVRIFDPLGGQVHVLEADGTYAESLGEQGEGPGELSVPVQMVVHRTGVMSILDIGKWGIVRFSADGTYLQDLPLGFGQKSFERLIPAPFGTLVTPGLGMVGTVGGVPQIVEGPLVPIQRLFLDGSPARTIHYAWDPPELEGGRAVTNTAGPKVYAVPPLISFEPRLHLEVMRDGRILVADSVTWTLEVLASDGLALDTYTRPIPPIVVTEEIRARERARLLQQLADDGPDKPVPGWLETETARIEEMLFWEELPVIDQLAVDWDSHIWVERTDPGLSGDGPIDIMRGDGTYLGTIPADGLRIPSAFGPDGLAAYLRFDEFDVPTVTIVRITGLVGQGPV